MKMFIFSLFLVVLGCSATVSETATSENDAGEAADTVPVQADQPPADAAVATDAFVPTDASASDTGPIQPTIRLSPLSPPARTVPPNSTGVLLGVYEIQSGSTMLPIRGFRVRRVGVGLPTDFANLYAFMVPRSSTVNEPFRYTTGRSLNPQTQTSTIIHYAGDLHPNWTLSVYLYGDFAPATVGGQHAFELVEVLTDTGSLAGSAVRSQAITIGAQRATRVDVRPVPMEILIPRNRPGQIVASFALNVGTGAAECGNIALAMSGGTPPALSFQNIELWLGEQRIAIDTNVGVIDNRVVLTPLASVLLAAGRAHHFTVRATVTAPVGTTFRFYLEYPSDIRLRDVATGEAAAACIGNLHIPGCDDVNQGMYDGLPGSKSRLTVIE